MHAGARAETAFIIGASDGYGVDECLERADNCGRIVADAWCEAKGRGAAIAFGRADEMTGIVAISRAAPAAPRDAGFVVTCRD